MGIWSASQKYRKQTGRLRSSTKLRTPFGCLPRLCRDSRIASDANKSCSKFVTDGRRSSFIITNLTSVLSDICAGNSFFVSCYRSKWPATIFLPSYLIKYVVNYYCEGAEDVERNVYCGVDAGTTYHEEGTCYLEYPVLNCNDSARLPVQLPCSSLSYFK